MFVLPNVKADLWRFLNGCEGSHVTWSVVLTNVRRVVPRGRPKPPDPDPATIRRLRRLYEARQRAEADALQAADELAVAAAEACDVEHVTRRQLADALGAGVSTVQGWVTHGRQLRGSPD